MLGTRSLALPHLPSHHYCLSLLPHDTGTPRPQDSKDSSPRNERDADPQQTWEAGARGPVFSRLHSAFGAYWKNHMGGGLCGWQQAGLAISLDLARSPLRCRLPREALLAPHPELSREPTLSVCSAHGSVLPLWTPWGWPFRTPATSWTEARNRFLSPAGGDVLWTGSPGGASRACFQLQVTERQGCVRRPCGCVG